MVGSGCFSVTCSLHPYKEVKEASSSDFCNGKRPFWCISYRICLVGLRRRNITILAHLPLTILVKDITTDLMSRKRWKLEPEVEARDLQEIWSPRCNRRTTLRATSWQSSKSILDISPPCHPSSWLELTLAVVSGATVLNDFWSVSLITGVLPSFAALASRVSQQFRHRTNCFTKPIDARSRSCSCITRRLLCPSTST